MKISQILPSVVSHELGAFLGIHKVDNDTQRGSTMLDFSQRRLIAADLIMSGDLELWYELFAQKEESAEQVTLQLTWVSDLPTPPGIQFILKFSDKESVQHILESNMVTWQMPVADLIDPRNGRVRTPIVLTLFAH